MFLHVVRRTTPCMMRWVTALIIKELKVNNKDSESVDLETTGRAVWDGVPRYLYLTDTTL